MQQECIWHGDIVTNSSTFLELIIIRVKDYTKEAVEHLIIALTIYILLCLLLYYGVTYGDVIGFRKDVKNPRRVLFVTAHPDDECMFFGPTVLNFTRNKSCSVYLLCLSTGANYGMGKTRKNELYKSCKILGIEDSHIAIQSHSLLPDSMTESWPIELVAELILNQVDRFNIDTVITFDKHGVSRHMNHCSIYYAVAHLSIEQQLPEYCTVYILDSVNIIRKYWLLLDIPLSYLLSRIRYFTSFEDRLIIHEAMDQHASQLVWFRRLYMFFSRFTIINTLQELNIDDIQFDLELDE